MNHDDLAEEAVQRALALVCAVRDEGPDETARILRGLDADQARALVVTLAAMVDPDKTVTELLAWTDWQPPAPKVKGNRHVPLEGLMDARVGKDWTADRLRWCAAEYRRLLKAGEPIPDDVQEGRRHYTRLLEQERRRRLAGQVAA